MASRLAPFLLFSLSTLLLLSPSAPSTLSNLLLLPPRAPSTLFVEYIGSEFTGVEFADVPINRRITNFQFVLSFATDYTTSFPHNPTSGKFNVFWDSDTLGPTQISAVKYSHRNVQVAVSLGGATVGGKTVEFQPTSIDLWVSNAVSSLTRIIHSYGLDGIDINYQSFQYTDPSTFAECIGQLVTTLKRNGVIRFASISPLPKAEKYYLELWNQYKNVIDQINFQFYAYPATTTVDQFLGYYDSAVLTYKGGNMLISFSTEPEGGGLGAKDFMEAAEKIKAEGELRGIAVWTADTSKRNRFRYDEEAQALLVS